LESIWEKREIEEGAGRKLMNTRVYIPGYLRQFSDGSDWLHLDGDFKTLGEVLDRLWKEHEGMKDRVLTDQGQIREHLNIFVGQENVRYTGGLSTPIVEDAEIFIIPAVSGG
jgi:molybdopterin synthase sulfur carrier subunit